jgi:hypothetical protein
MACNIWITIGECDNKILTITAFALNQRFNSNQIHSVFGNRQFENNSDYRLKKYGHGFWVQNTQRLERIAMPKWGRVHRDFPILLY